MVSGNSVRMDNRRLSSGCSAATCVLFVSLCLLAVWLLTSSTVVPIERNSEVKQGVSQISRTYEDNSGNANDANTEENTGSSAEDLQTERKLDNNNAKREDSIRKNNENSMDRSDNFDISARSSDGSGKSSETAQDEVDNASKSQMITDENGSTDGRITDSELQIKKDRIDDDSGNNQRYTDETKGDEQEKLQTEEEKSGGNANREFKGQDQEEYREKEAAKSSMELTTDTEVKENSRNEEFPAGAQSEILKETNVQNAAWSTQTVESKNEKEIQSVSSETEKVKYSWKLCNVTAGTDYIPCLDNEAAIKKLRSTKHYEHRERHCPDKVPTCLVPLPEGYKQPVPWPISRDKIWYSNVPRTKLATVKGHQNWVKMTGEYLTFPGGGTQFKHGALRYIDFIQECWPDIAWGKSSHVVLDVGCGVASFGGYLFDKNVFTISLAPKDEHEAQVQFALERGIPAISAVMGTKRLPFPARVFDIVHCARCRVPWHIEGGKLLLELNRMLRPGGYFLWSATPVYQNIPQDVEIWQAMSELTKSMCWEMVNKSRDRINEVGVAIFKKPMNNECYESRQANKPPICEESDDANAAWNVPLQACMHSLPVQSNVRGSQWPAQWPKRAVITPYWFDSSQSGVYGKPAPADFQADYEHWKHVVGNSYVKGLGLDWSKVRNVMDMRAVYGGFATVLRDMSLWVMNIVTIDSPDTLPIIFERGLFGMYHDWCESFSTYPRTYDLLHADHLFSSLKSRCKLLPVIVEVDRILRPEGKLIVRDKREILDEIESITKSLHWETRMAFSKEKEGLLFAQKKMWRPTQFETITSMS